MHRSKMRDLEVVKAEKKAVLSQSHNILIWLIPLIGVCLSFVFFSSTLVVHIKLSFFESIKQFRIRLMIAVITFLTIVYFVYRSWYGRAIAPRKGRKGALIDDPNDDQSLSSSNDGDSSDDEDDTPKQGDLNSPIESPLSHYSLTHPPALLASQSLPAALDVVREPINDKDHLDDMQRLSEFWHPDTPNNKTRQLPQKPVIQSLETLIDVTSSKPITESITQSNPALPESLYFLASTKFVSSLSKEEFRSMFAEVEWKRFEPGQTIYKLNDPSDGLFIVVSGSVDMMNDKGTHVCSHNVGELVGDEAIMTTLSVHHAAGESSSRAEQSSTNEPRWLTCIASEKTGVKVIVFNQKLLNQWSRDRAELIVSFVRTSIARQWRQASFVLHQFFKLPQQHRHQSISPSDHIHRFSVKGIDEFFANHKHGQSIDEWLDKLSEERTRFVPTGQILFEEATHSHQNSLFIVRKGEFRATRRDSSSFLTHSRGCILDSLAFLCDTPHHYTLTASSDAEVTWLSPSHFTTKLGHPALLDLVGLIIEEMKPTIKLFTQLGMKREWCRAGQVLFRQGQQSGSMFVISSGRVRIVNEKAERSRDHNSTNSGRRATGPTPLNPEHSEMDGGEPNPEDPASSPSESVNEPAKADGEQTDDDDDYRTPEELGPNAYGRYDPTKRFHASIRLELGRSDCVGESSFLQSDDPETRHSATALCVRDSEVIRISRASFRCLIETYPTAVHVLATILSKRMSHALSRKHDEGENQHITSRVKCVCIALVPLPHVDMDSFAGSLASALGAHGSTLLLRPALVDSILGHGTSANLSSYYHRSRFTVWLTEQEESHSFLLFQASPEHDAWTSMCVRSADYAFVVAHAKKSPIPVGKLEQQLIWDAVERQRARKQEQKRNKVGWKPVFSFCVNDLVLLHEPDTVLPSGTRFWFRSRPHLHTYHHVRIGLPSHFDRLARYLANRSVGLVLGGGGARGLAHEGVVKAMMELGVSCDFIGGTSQGAMMGALFAQMPVQHSDHLSFLEKKAHDMAVQMGSLLILLTDATWPSMAYFSGRVFSDAIRSIIGADLRIEDLWIKYFCVSVNVSRADIVVHTSGSLWKAARASMTILEYLPPMQLSNTKTDLLIDGGYVDNCPVDCMRELYSPACVIASDVERKTDQSLQKLSYFGDSLSGWWLLRNKLALMLPNFLQFSKPAKLPRYADIISSLIYIQHSRNLRQFMSSQMMDVYIRPKLGEGVQLLDYHKEKEIVEIGYKSAKVSLTEWKLCNPSFPNAVNDIDIDVEPAFPTSMQLSRSLTGIAPSDFVYDRRNASPGLPRSLSTKTFAQ